MLVLFRKLFVSSKLTEKFFQIQFFMKIKCMIKSILYNNIQNQSIFVCFMSDNKISLTPFFYLLAKSGYLDMFTKNFSSWVIKLKLTFLKLVSGSNP